MCNASLGILDDMVQGIEQAGQITGRERRKSQRQREQAKGKGKLGDKSMERDM